MTGTGTQNDPYIVDTWEDFITATSTSGAYVKMADNIVWDMNNIAPNGIDRINCTCAELDGNGAEIHNLYFNVAGENGVFYMPNSVHDISFLNFLSKQDSANYAHTLIYLASSSNIQRVVFSGVISGSRNQFIFDGVRYEQVKNCSFNLKMQLGSSKVYIADHTRTAAGYYENNHIIIDATNALIYNSDFDIHSDNSLIEIVRAENDTAILPRSNARSTIVRYDKGTVREENYVFDTTGAWHSVTSAQLQDATYLASIGFPIGVD